MNLNIDYNSYYNNLSSIQENPNKNKYSFSEKIKTSLSCVSFFIAIFLPSGDHFNIYIFLLMITSFLHHFSDKFLKYNSYEYMFLERIDWIGLIFFFGVFLSLDNNINIFLSIIVFLGERIVKDIIILFMGIYTIYVIYLKDSMTGIYIFFLMLICLIVFHNNMKLNGWNFYNTWGWHLCSLQLMIAMKLFFI